MMSLRFKIIKDPDLPAFAHEQVRQVRANQPSTACNKRVFCHDSSCRGAPRGEQTFSFFAAEDSRHYERGQIRSRPSRSMMPRKNVRVAGAMLIVDFAFSPRSSSQT